MNKQKIFSILPSVEHLLSTEKVKELNQFYSRHIVRNEFRNVLDQIRNEILNDMIKELDREQAVTLILERVELELQKKMQPSLKPVINATGIILHTGLGRAPLSKNACDNVTEIIKGYSNLEIDLSTGKRGQRTGHVEELLCELTGAEAVAVVNNNAAALLLSLNTMSFGKETIISRGQLVEIGGSFRVPDVMAKSGTIMHEVGTTNKTKISDYSEAIGENTGLICVAHPSNYRILGFTTETELSELAELAHQHSIPVLHDLGGGVVVDLTQFGLPYEPLVQDSLKAGVDVATFSGDKVLGGPQCGIIVGSKEWLKKIHSNPLMRALRCDKIIYAALEATLKLYLNENTLFKENKTLRLLVQDMNALNEKAEQCLALISNQTKKTIQIKKENSQAQTGSGALPLEKLESIAISLFSENFTAEKVAEILRMNEPPILGYIKNDKVYLDMMVLEKEDLPKVAEAINDIPSKMI